MTIEELFGTLQMSVVSGWRKHLRTAKYAKHEALDEFYKEMPEKVDALIEAWMGAHGKKIGSFQNILSSSNMNTLKYLGELKRVCKEGYNLINDNDELKSLLDDIVNLINSTLYKVKELAESKSFKSLVEYVNESLVNESLKAYTLYFEREDLDPEELQSELDGTGFFEYCEVDFDSCDENTCQVHVTCSSSDLKKASKNIEGLADWVEE